MKYPVFKKLLSLIIFISTNAMAQVSVDISGNNVRISNGKVIVSGDDQDSGSISPDAEIEGVTIINNKVFIDGVEVKRGQSVVKSKKSKKTYLIDWGKNGNISVTEK